MRMAAKVIASHGGLHPSRLFAEGVSAEDGDLLFRLDSHRMDYPRGTVQVNAQVRKRVRVLFPVAAVGAGWSSLSLCLSRQRAFNVDATGIGAARKSFDAHTRQKRCYHAGVEGVSTGPCRTVGETQLRNDQMQEAAHPAQRTVAV
jgi:hypothetical protein